MFKIESYDFVHTHIRRPLMVHCFICGNICFAPSSKICSKCKCELPSAKRLLNECNDRVQYFKGKSIKHDNNRI